MAIADGCYLNIPFKEYLKRLKLDADGKIDAKALDLAASQEFENYKAIERRINDPSCGNEQVPSNFFAQLDTYALTMDGSGIDNATLTVSFERYANGVTVGASSVIVPSGLWHFSFASNAVIVPGDIGPFRLAFAVIDIAGSVDWGGNFGATINVFDPMQRDFAFMSGGDARVVSDTAEFSFQVQAQGPVGEGVGGGALSFSGFRVSD